MIRRYRKIETSVSKLGTRYKQNAIYPEIPLSENDVYVITQYGDRYDTLALEFYQDPSLWWIIASGNNFYKGSLNITPGVQLRIPADKSAVINLYDEVNTNR